MNNVSSTDRLLHFLSMVESVRPGELAQWVELHSTDLVHCQLISPQFARRLFEDWVDARVFTRQDTSTPNRPRWSYHLSDKGAEWFERQTDADKWLACSRLRSDIARRAKGDKTKLDLGVIPSVTPIQKKLF